MFQELGKYYERNGYFGMSHARIRRSEILLEFIDALSRADENKEIIMGQVKETVLALNVLNEKCEYELIETDQREDICKFIITAVNVAGLKTDEDVTEEWREW